MKFFIIITATLCLNELVYSQDIIPPEQLGQELQTFYRHPSTQLLNRIIYSIDHDDNFVSNENAHPPFIGFLTTAFSQYSNDFDTYQKMADNLVYTKDIVSFSLMLSQVKDTVVNWDGHSPSINDMIWGGFFASGNEKYLTRLVSEMKFCEENDSLMLYLTGSSAKWSLCSNARQYEEVKNYLKKASKDCSEEMCKHIKEVLKSKPSALREKMIEGIAKFKKK